MTDGEWAGLSCWVRTYSNESIRVLDFQDGGLGLPGTLMEGLDRHGISSVGGMHSNMLKRVGLNSDWVWIGLGSVTEKRY